MAKIVYEGSPLQKALNINPSETKDYAYQDSQLKKDVESNKKQTNVKKSIGGGGGGTSPNLSNQQGQSNKLQEVITPPSNKLTNQISQSRQPNTIKSQLEKPPTVISAFKSQDVAFPYPTKQELGGDSSFFTKVGDFIGREYRMLTNQKIAKDLRTERSIPIYYSNDIPVKNIPTRTVIDSYSGIKTDSTLMERGELQYFMYGVGTPTEFKMENIAKNYQNKAQEQLNLFYTKEQEKRAREDTKLQTSIDTGILTIDQAKDIQKGLIKESELKLDLKAEELNVKTQKDFETQASSFLKQEQINRNVALGSLNIAREAQKIDVYPALKAGAIVGGSLVNAPVTLGLTVGLGAAELFSVPGRPTKEEKFSVALEGVTDVAIGLQFPKVLKTEIQSARLESELGKLSGKGYEFGNLKELKYSLSKNQDFSFVKGTRSTEFLKEQLTVGGTVIKRGNQFVMPEGAGNRIITGVIPDVVDFGPRISPKFFASGENFLIGAKGFSVPISEKFTFSAGSGSIVKLGESSTFMKTSKAFSSGGLSDDFLSNLGNMKTFKYQKSTDKNLYGAFTEKVKDDVFLTRSGRLTGGNGLNINVKDTTVTKVVDFKAENLVTGSGFDDIVFSDFGTKFVKPSGSQASKQFSSFTTTSKGPGSFESSIITNIAKNTKPTTSSINIPKVSVSSGSYAGLGLYERTSTPEEQFISARNNLRSRTVTPSGLSGLDLRNNNFGGLDIKGSNSFGSFTNQGGFSNLGDLSSNRVSDVSKSFGGSLPRISVLSASSLNSSQGSKLGIAQVSGLKSSSLTTQKLKGSGFSFEGFSPPSPRTTFGGFDFGTGFILPPFPSLSGSSLYGKPTRRRKTRGVKIKPSFTASAFDIRGSLPKVGKFGITPLQLRKLPI